MISEAELRRWAGTWSADPMIVDLDYVLGCFLSQWYQDKKAIRLRFKGGTCLRKCYFPDYRFSEDLDVVKPLLVDKFKAKNITLNEHSLENLLTRRDEFERDWELSLSHLLPTSESTSFSSAWETCVNALRTIV